LIETNPLIEVGKVNAACDKFSGINSESARIIAVAMHIQKLASIDSLYFSVLGTQAPGFFADPKIARQVLKQKPLWTRGHIVQKKARAS
jgi:hypothetical protein